MLKHESRKNFQTETIKKVLIIGSGPIIIGQAAEFDYSGAQAALACREEGVETVLVNSNPATIQTDREVADIVYIEPLTPEFLEKIISKERPRGLMATVGGQTGLNLATLLDEKGVLKKYKVEVLGTDINSIALGESREKFKQLMQGIGQPMLPSKTVRNIAAGLEFAQKVGLPLIIRGAYTLGGTGSTLVRNKNQLKVRLEEGLKASMIGEVLMEKSLVGVAELEYEMVRDHLGNKIMICNMENLDPLGVHTGESIVVAPSQTLSDRDHQLLRDAAFKIVDALHIRGSCNIQFALNQDTGQYFVIEVNPRLSRSSALASKATGYPIAKVATKIALGKNLPQITNDITGKSAFFEPALDYVVVKIPRWPDDKFLNLDQSIGVKMKSTGEVMAIGRNFEEATLKAIKSLDIKQDIFRQFLHLPAAKMKNLLQIPNTKRLSAIFASFQKGYHESEIQKLTKIHPWFINKLNNLYKSLSTIVPAINVFKMVDTCAGEFEAFTPYFYSSHGAENEATPFSGPKVLILGSGPIRIGQGVEFDYLTVHAIKALKEKGVKAIIINNNPETVSTDYAISDRLYFEPLTPDFVMQVIDNEREGLLGVIPQFGGQTALNLVDTLQLYKVPILGTQAQAINAAEDRKQCAKILSDLGYEMAPWRIAHSKDEVLHQAKSLGYPVVIRPSFVLGGEGMIIAHDADAIKEYLAAAHDEVFEKPVLVDKFLAGAMELDVDFISDGQKTLSFVLEQLQAAGIHSGDSDCVYPAQRVSQAQQRQIKQMTHKIARAFFIIGMGNIQLAVKGKKIFVLEVNPRASRTVPFLSKCLGLSLAKLATRVILGEALPELKFKNSGLVAIKSPVFSFEKLDGVSQTLGPLMKSTGEKMSIGKTYKEALYKAQNGHKKSARNMGVYPLK